MPDSHSEPLDFFWTTFELTENMSAYAPGGFHPIVLGDILVGHVGNYRIIHKLGWGAHATVWLAEQTESGLFVSLKVTTAKNYAEQEEREGQLLWAAQNHPNIVTLYDSFTVEGPNGTHSVLVSELVVPLDKLCYPRCYKRPVGWLKDVARGLIEGLAHLHARGIVHGDLHFGNVGVAVPTLAKPQPFDISREMDRPEVTPILLEDPAHQTSSFPIYLIIPSSLSSYYNRATAKASVKPVAKIYDFGSARAPGCVPQRYDFVRRSCAPETAFAKVVYKIQNPMVESPCDIWALGTLIFELFMGDWTIHHNLSLMLEDMTRLAGYVPPTWISALPEIAKTTHRDADKLWMGYRAQLKRTYSDDSDADRLVAFLRRIFVLDAAARPTAAELLLDPWLAGSYHWVCPNVSI